jgi:hypothetical protein
MKEQNANSSGTFKFYSSQSLWLGFMALKRGQDGAELSDGLNIHLQAVYTDILSILNKLYRSRRLLIDHLRVLNFYGRKGRAPRAWVKKEMRAHSLWREALHILSSPMIERGYLVSDTARKWQEETARLDALLQGQASDEKLEFPDFAAFKSKTPYAEYKGH